MPRPRWSGRSSDWAAPRSSGPPDLPCARWQHVRASGSKLSAGRLSPQSVAVSTTLCPGLSRTSAAANSTRQEHASWLAATAKISPAGRSASSTTRFGRRDRRLFTLAAGSADGHPARHSARPLLRRSPGSGTASVAAPARSPCAARPRRWAPQTDPGCSVLAHFAPGVGASSHRDRGPATISTVGPLAPRVEG